MSSLLVKQALEIVDPTAFKGNGNKSNKKSSTKNSKAKQDKTNKRFRLDKNKYTVIKARENFKPKKVIYKENLEKLKLLKEASRLDLDKNLVAQIIERGVTKRPVKLKKNRKPAQKTAFTEEDFKKFEEEYLNE